MKWHGIGLLILVILVLCLQTACTSGDSLNSLNCSRGGEVCISTKIAQSFAMGKPVMLSITVTSSKDIPELNITLTKPADVIIDGPQNWENGLTTSSNERLLAYWTFAIKAGQTLTFNRVLHFPSREDFFQIFAEAIAQGRIIYAVDNFEVQITHNGGHIIRAGTPYLPYTPNAASTVYGPGTPVPTFLPAAMTPNPSAIYYFTPTRFSPLLATSTSRTSPYPPPPSSSTTPPPYP